MPLSFLWIQVLTNPFLQFFKLDWLRPIIKAFDFPGWVNKHEPFGMKLLVDGLPENLSPYSSYVSEVPGQK